jgi:hypothetical protein
MGPFLQRYGRKDEGQGTNGGRMRSREDKSALQYIEGAGRRGGKRGG